MSAFRSQRAQAIENLALRRQLSVLQRTVKRPLLGRTDRLLWVLFSRFWSGWRESLLSARYLVVGDGGPFGQLVPTGWDSWKGQPSRETGGSAPAVDRSLGLQALTERD